MAALRMDVLLHRLCLTRSRTEAKAACAAGAVLLNGRAAAASDAVPPGAHVVVRYARRTLEFELLGTPDKNTSRKAARDLYETLRDEPAPASW